jgi:hypothetical protein
MTVHQCPKCELRFGWKTELEDHCWHDHPEFRHDYPATTVAVAVEPVPVAVPHPVERQHHDSSELFRWLRPTTSKDPAVHHPRE